MVIIHPVVLSVSTGVILSFEKIILLYKAYSLRTKEDITIKMNSQVVNYIGEQAKAMSELMMLNSLTNSKNTLSAGLQLTKRKNMSANKTLSTTRKY